MIAIELNSDSTVGELRELLGKVRNPQKMLRTVATRAEDMLKAHFHWRDQESPNRLRGERKHFWRQVADSVYSEIDEAEGAVRLAVAHPHFAQKVYGGVIRPKRAKYLTIPVTAESYGKKAWELEEETGLRLFVYRGGESLALAARMKNARGLKVYYLLKSSVNQDPDDDAMPYIEDLEEAVLEAAKEELAK